MRASLRSQPAQPESSGQPRKTIASFFSREQHEAQPDEYTVFPCPALDTGKQYKPDEAQPKRPLAPSSANTVAIGKRPRQASKLKLGRGGRRNHESLRDDGVADGDTGHMKPLGRRTKCAPVKATSTTGPAAHAKEAGNSAGIRSDTRSAAQPSVSQECAATIVTSRPGLRNLGYTCYANSVIQALYSCQDFRAALAQRFSLGVEAERIAQKAQSDPESRNQDPAALTVQQGSHQKPSNNGFLHAAPKLLAELFQQLQPNVTAIGALANATPPASVGGMPCGASCSQVTEHRQAVVARNSVDDRSTSAVRSSSPVRPKAFVDCLWNDISTPFPRGQHDAQEFLRLLLDAVGQQLPQPVATGAACNDVGATETREAKQMGIDVAAIQNHVEKLFGGTMRSTTRCMTCESESYRLESFMDLSLPTSICSRKATMSTDGAVDSVTEFRRQQTLQAAIEHFLASERLTGVNKYRCDECHSLVEAERRHDFVTLPPLLVVHLKLFGGDSGSGRTRVACPAVLTLDTESISQAEGDPRPPQYGKKSQTTTMEYELLAVVLHKGASQRSGHYVAMARAEPSELLYPNSDMGINRPSVHVQSTFADSQGKSSIASNSAGTKRRVSDVQTPPSSPPEKINNKQACTTKGSSIDQTVASGSALPAKPVVAGYNGGIPTAGDQCGEARRWILFNDDRVDVLTADEAEYRLGHNAQDESSSAAVSTGSAHTIDAQPSVFGSSSGSEELPYLLFYKLVEGYGVRSAAAESMRADDSQTVNVAAATATAAATTSTAAITAAAPAAALVVSTAKHGIIGGKHNADLLLPSTMSEKATEATTSEASKWDILNRFTVRKRNKIPSPGK
eukprot:SAG31_NODE_6_length_43291_cov_191.503496_9_plen_851_part_00